MANAEITPESIVQRARKLLYPAHSTDDMILEHALADPDSVIVKNLNVMPNEHLNSLDRVCHDYKTALSTAEKRLEKGEIEGCFHDGHYYPDQSYVGKSLEETVEGLQPKYKASLQEGVRGRNRMGYTATAVNAPGVLLAVVPTILFGALLEKRSPSNGTSGNLGLTLLTGIGFAALGTVATATALALYNLPLGIAYGVAAFGSAATWWNMGKQNPKDVESYEQLLTISYRNRTLKDNMHNLLFLSQ